MQSRYYDPNIGRFKNVDALASTGQGLLGNNIFAYCNNNPVMFHDSNGLCREVGALLTWVDCNSIFCPTSSNYRPHITPPTQSKAKEVSTPTATFSYGFSGNVNIGPTTYGVQGFITLDSDGYAAIQYSVFSGVSAGPDSDKYSAGIVPFIMMTNAGKYSDLEGPGFALGASCKDYSIDYVGALNPNDTSIINYQGLSINLPGKSIGGSSGNVHVIGSKTWTAIAVPFDWDTYYKITQY